MSKHEYYTIEKTPEPVRYCPVHHVVEILFDESEQPAGTKQHSTASTTFYGEEIEALKATVLPLLDHVQYFSIHVMRDHNGTLRIDKNPASTFFGMSLEGLIEASKNAE